MEYFKDNKTGSCVVFLSYGLKDKTKTVQYKTMKTEEVKTVTEQEWLNGMVGNKRRFEKIDKPFESLSSNQKPRGGMIYS